MESLEDKIKAEKEAIEKLKSLFKVFALLPEQQEEYDIMSKTYKSVGTEYINEMRVLMGNITNPSMNEITKRYIIGEIPKTLDLLEKSGKNVEYLRISYDMALKFSGLPEYKG